MWICFRIVSLKTIDTGASSWLFYFCILILARYKNENRTAGLSALYAPATLYLQGNSMVLVFDGILISQYLSTKHEEVSFIKILNVTYVKKIRHKKKPPWSHKTKTYFSFCRYFPMGYFNHACEILLKKHIDQLEVSLKFVVS